MKGMAAFVILAICGMVIGHPIDICTGLDCVSCVNSKCVFCILSSGSCHNSTLSCPPNALIIPAKAIDLCPKVTTTTSSPLPPDSEYVSSYLIIVLYIISAITLIVVITFGCVFGMRAYHRRTASSRHRCRQEKREVDGQISQIRYQALEEAVEARRIRMERHNIALESSPSSEGYEAQIILPCPSRPLHTPEQLWTDEEVKAIFKAFDGDNDGVISTEDLRLVMLRLGIHLSLDEVGEMIELLDTDHVARVTFAEFREFLHTMDRLTDETFTSL